MWKFALLSLSSERLLSKVIKSYGGVKMFEIEN